MALQALKKKVFTLVLVHTPFDFQNGHRILLGMKKRGFGQDRWNGFGGKIEPNETIEQAAARELKEESGITALDLSKRGIIAFEFEKDPTLLEVHVFQATKYTGSPTETDEMKPAWFSVDQIPYASMWPDDELWFPYFFAGKRFVSWIYFQGQSKVLASHIQEIPDRDFDGASDQTALLYDLVRRHTKSLSLLTEQSINTYDSGTTVSQK